MAAEAMHAGLEVLGPHLARSDIKAKGTIVIGTVKGDNHDIGKNLVAMMLECAGYRVIDLGVNVSKGKFLAAAKKYQAHIVAISALLTTTMAEMEAVVADVRPKAQQLEDPGRRRAGDRVFCRWNRSRWVQLGCRRAVSVARSLVSA